MHMDFACLYLIHFFPLFASIGLTYSQVQCIPTIATQTVASTTLEAGWRSILIVEYM
jgi:hypothetical protein